MRKRIFSAVLLIGFLTVVFFTGIAQTNEKEITLFGKKKKLTVWYTDGALTNYMNSSALSYEEETGIKVNTELVSGVEYLEQINEASVFKKQSEADMPDVYVISNDSLEKAYLAGLAVEIQNKEDFVNEDNYPKAALSAVTYQDKMVGYPFYYETSVFLYNYTYMEEFAKKTIENEANAKEGEAAMELIDAAGSEEEAENQLMATESEELDIKDSDVADKLDAMIPSTIEEILTFAEEYDAPEQVEAVFRWNVSDIFYNYFIVGNYLSVGGDAGDDPENIRIYNKETMECLLSYQALNQFFAIETKEVSYTSILEEFMEGKTVFTVATTDAIAMIEQAKAVGEFVYEYGVATMPDVSEALKSRSLSVTNAAVVNGYSQRQKEADDFAKFLTYDCSDNLYTRTGKIASRADIAYENEWISATLQEYDSSVPIPKMLETSNFWVELEIVFTKVWEGEDVNDTLRALSEKIMTQISGREYVEEYIETPITEEDDLEEE